MYSIWPASNASITAAVASTLFIAHPCIGVDAGVVDASSDCQAPPQFLFDLLDVVSGELSSNATAHNLAVQVEQAWAVQDLFAHRGLSCAAYLVHKDRIHQRLGFGRCLI